MKNRVLKGLGPAEKQKARGNSTISSGEGKKVAGFCADPNVAMESRWSFASKVASSVH